MNRRGVIKAGLGPIAAAGAAALAAPAVAQSRPQIRWRMPTSFPRVLDIPHRAAELVADAVREASDGAFEIEVFPAGELVPAFEVVDAVGSGSVECCFSSSIYFWGKEPTFALGTALPFGLNSRMQNAWMYAGRGIDLMNVFYRRFNLVGIPGGNTGAQMGGWFRREISSLADLDGLKMRVAGLGGAVLGKLGVVPQQLSGGDTYAALERGVIDAAEYVGPYDDEQLGLERVARYYYYPGWWEGGTVLHFFVNYDQWMSLPPTYQAMFAAAAGEANVVTQARFDAGNPQALARLIARGAELRPFGTDILDAAFAATGELVAELRDQSEDFRTIVDSMLAFRATEYAWFQVAEFSYDSYLIAQMRRGAL
ncbi:MAG: TRAP transporter substrate-binding protein [Bauldia sp.]